MATIPSPVFAKRPFDPEQAMRRLADRLEKASVEIPASLLAEVQEYRAALELRRSDPEVPSSLPGDASAVDIARERVLNRQVIEEAKRVQAEQAVERFRAARLRAEAAMPELVEVIRAEVDAALTEGAQALESITEHLGECPGHPSDRLDRKVETWYRRARRGDVNALGDAEERIKRAFGLYTALVQDAWLPATVRVNGKPGTVIQLHMTGNDVLVLPEPMKLTTAFAAGWCGYRYLWGESVRFRDASEVCKAWHTDGNHAGVLAEPVRPY